MNDRSAMKRGDFEVIAHLFKVSGAATQSCLAALDKSIARGADLSLPMHNAGTPLYELASSGSIAGLITHFLERGADPRRDPSAGGSSFSVAVFQLLNGFSEEDHDSLQLYVHQVLSLQSPSVLDGWDFVGDMTALHYSVEAQDQQLVKALLAAGADPDCRANTEFYAWATPLQIAVEAGNLELARVLVEHGADPDLSIGLSGSARDALDQAPETERALLAAILRRERDP